MNVCVIIPAGGKGERFGSETPKQFIDLKGKPVIVHTIENFNEIDDVKSIVIAVHSEWFTFTKELVQSYKLEKVKDIVVGGKERQDSIYNALHSKATLNADIILIHDSVRPFISHQSIKKVITAADDNGAVILGTTPKDPVKEIDYKSEVIRTLQRGKLSISQTPQAFWRDIIMNSYEKAREANYVGADSSQLVEFAGYKVSVIEGEDTNIKITTPLDLKIAELFLEEKTKEILV
ncbi:MAG TPA: 2-C-methyl-D-erythritol 4-phosphate cytidylyltransferase [Candidatus Kapabacteria bacterium]|jgi:2-C-methyl-D-erythritol 4-phosphate cytidylyltransferase|nr:2-C-methyl-D-erythritol 4-phosphate cytidylyltransferase [Candidatus Kapabacteria bacterium]HOV92820.1 2-C-methyl-D-erythritol 4-phosphate cytidylyltransferase [Candidatus Kapabacteria bacterium]